MSRAAEWTCQACGRTLARLLPRRTLAFHLPSCAAVYASPSGGHLVHCVCGRRVLLRGRGQRGTLSPETTTEDVERGELPATPLGLAGALLWLSLSANVSRI